MNQFNNDIKHSIFPNKEAYLTFRQEWKDFINSGKAKKRVDKRYGNKYKVLRSYHHLFYAMVRGADITKGFHSQEALKEALTDLKWVVHYGFFTKNFEAVFPKSMQYLMPEPKQSSLIAKLISSRKEEEEFSLLKTVIVEAIKVHGEAA